MDYEAIDALRTRHPAWRLLRATNASLILSFVGDFFVENNRGASSASVVAAALDDQLYALNREAGGDEVETRFPKDPHAYLEDWSATEAGFLRRFYPAGDDEVHYEATPAFERAYAWVESLRARSFVGTESRLHTVLELLRQIVHGSQSDPDLRLAEPPTAGRDRRADRGRRSRQRRSHGRDGCGDRYQQFSATARDLLSDFREVEETSAAWTGPRESGSPHGTAARASCSLT